MNAGPTHSGSVRNRAAIAKRTGFSFPALRRRREAAATPFAWPYQPIAGKWSAGPVQGNKNNKY